MRRTRHVVLPVKSWQYMGLMIVSLACLTLGLVSRDREGRAGSLAGPELQKHTAPHEVDACPNVDPLVRLAPCDDEALRKGPYDRPDGRDVRALVGSRSPSGATRHAPLENRRRDDVDGGSGRHRGAASSIRVFRWRVDGGGGGGTEMSQRPTRSTAEERLGRRSASSRMEKTREGESLERRGGSLNAGRDSRPERRRRAPLSAGRREANRRSRTDGRGNQARLRERRARARQGVVAGERRQSRAARTSAIASRTGGSQERASAARRNIGRLDFPRARLEMQSAARTDVETRSRSDVPSPQRRRANSNQRREYDDTVDRPAVRRLGGIRSQERGGRAAERARSSPRRNVERESVQRHSRSQLERSRDIRTRLADPPVRSSYGEEDRSGERDRRQQKRSNSSLNSRYGPAAAVAAAAAAARNVDIQRQIGTAERNSRRTLSHGIRTEKNDAYVLPNLPHVVGESAYIENYEGMRQTLLLAMCALYGASLLKGKGGGSSSYSNILARTNRFVAW